ncbi:hypothetical protein Amal_03871 [Acetobacter malorum]|uniref:Uncharacterized protein n=1 Tax=Acetobacter malorum TaxID=178901 RepID=A0A177G616_9PROT|nr:hypothetical protein Amal_03871 [Acetobacter malorum]
MRGQRRRTPCVHITWQAKAVHSERRRSLLTINLPAGHDLVAQVDLIHIDCHMQFAERLHDNPAADVRGAFRLERGSPVSQCPRRIHGNQATCCRGRNGQRTIMFLRQCRRMEAIGDGRTEGQTRRDLIAGRNLTGFRIPHIRIMLVAASKIQLPVACQMCGNIDISRHNITAEVACIAGVGPRHGIGPATI